jgi:hypothetical protein
MAGSRYKQGYYTPRFPDKYVGDVSKIRYMSSWELECHRFFDGNERVLRWASEEIAIPYIKPTDGKVHKYYPDYWVEFINAHGETIQEIIEVKPHEQTKAPRKTHKHMLYEQVMYQINIAKWAAAQEFCRQRNITFRIVTQRAIFK